MSELILALLKLMAKFGPEVVKDVTALIHGTPQLPNESDTDYIARLNVQIDANLADAEAKDKQVEAE